MAENNKENNPTEKKDLPTSIEPSSPTLPPPQILDWRQIVEKELGLVKTMDYIITESFDLCYQPTILDSYEKELLVPLINEGTNNIPLDSGRAFIKEESQLLKVSERTRAIIKQAEALCAAHGIKEGFNKKITKISFLTMTILMISFFIISSLEALAAYSSYIVIPFIFAICFVPNLLRNMVTKKWTDFKNQAKPELQNLEKENIQNLKVFVQDLLDDARERLIDNKMPLQLINFVLFSKEYKNLKYLRDQNIRGTITFLFQFEYPEGMTPFPVPSREELARKIETIEEAPSDDKDFFIVLKKAQFNDEGAIEQFEQKILSKDMYSEVTALLNASKFNTIEKPQEIMPSFEINTKIICDCKEPVFFKDLRYCVVQHASFEFYLAVGEPCTCGGKNPFVLFVSPGIKDIPEKWKKIFE